MILNKHSLQMKKIFLKTIITGLILSFIQLNAYAQCTPDLSLQSTGVYPVILPTAKVGLPYSEIGSSLFYGD